MSKTDEKAKLAHQTKYLNHDTSTGMEEHEKFIERAVELSRKGMDGNHGGPFGAVIVKQGKIIGEGYNRVTSDADPTAHAEVMAIRDACKRLGEYHLRGCVMYTSCEPCPMCLGAIYWARLEKIYFSCSREDAKIGGFDDSFIYDEVPLEPAERSIAAKQMGREIGLKVFQDWAKKADKKMY